MRTLLVFLFFVGVLLILLNERIYAVPKQVEYRYLPRDLDTYLRESTLAHVSMTDREDPFWTRSY